MTMADDRRKRLNAAKSISDVEQGDYVRRALGSRRVGLVEEVHNDGFAWVLWNQDQREYLPLAALRKVRPAGHDFDARREP
jgi:hypothetical protein